jgi:drug/metabolite transporter (DMT)-like permease
METDAASSVGRHGQAAIPGSIQRSQWALIFSIAILHAGGWIAAEAALKTIAPFTLASLRFVTAGAILVVIARWRGSSLGMSDLRSILAIALIGIALAHALMYTGLRMAPAADGVVLSTALIPALVAILAIPLLHERLSARGWVGVAISAAGVSAVILDAGSIAGEGGLGGDRLVGDIFVIGGIVATALYTIIGRVALRSGTPIGVVGSTTLIGGIALAPFALFEVATGNPQPWTTEAWVAFLYLTIPSAGLSAVMYYILISRSGAARASLVSYIVPVIVLAWSVVVAGQPPTLARTVGAILAIVGVRLVLTAAPGLPSPDTRLLATERPD